MKTSQVFEIALRNLWDGKSYEYKEMTKEKFCCLAIQEYVDSPDDSRRCQRILEDMLGEFSTLEGWLVGQGHLPAMYFKARERLLFRQKTQTTRKAWLQHLIKHYKSLGD